MRQAPLPSGPTTVVSRGHLIEPYEPRGAIEAFPRDHGSAGSPLLDLRGAPLDGGR